MVVERDSQQELLATFCERIARGEGIECLFFHQKRQYLFLGDYKYWTMADCLDIDLTQVQHVVPHRFLFRSESIY